MFAVGFSFWLPRYLFTVCGPANFDERLNHPTMFAKPAKWRESETVAPRVIVTAEHVEGNREPRESNNRQRITWHPHPGTVFRGSWWGSKGTELTRREPGGPGLRAKIVLRWRTVGVSPVQLTCLKHLVSLFLCFGLNGEDGIRETKRVRFDDTVMSQERGTTTPERIS